MSDLIALVAVGVLVITVVMVGYEIITARRRRADDADRDGEGG